MGSVYLRIETGSHVKNPKVSVIIPCYNGARTLAQTLESLRWQAFASWECILVDDGSNDASGEILESFRKTDDRFTCIRQENRGLAAARNRGLEAASGTFIQFLDADDLLLPGKLESAVRWLESNASTDAVYCDYVLYSPPTDFFQTLPARIPDAEAVQSFLFRWNINFIIPVHAFLFRREVVQAYKFSGDLKSHAEDVDCWIRMSLGGVRMAYHDTVGVIYRISTQSSTSDEERLILSRIKVLQSFGRDPALDRFAADFDRGLHHLTQRLAIAKFMKRNFREGMALFRKEWRRAGLTGNIKMAGWMCLMGITTKEGVERLRHWIVSRTGVRWGGWKFYRPWNPPVIVQQLLNQ